jgi:DNA-binding GntR family transcriptional regulator
MELHSNPIYQQLTVILRQIINSNEFSVGDQFLTEKAICNRFSVSKNTVNKAISILIQEGLLEFRKGLGNFVIAKASQYDLHYLLSFTRMAEDIGKTPSTRVLAFEEQDSGEVPTAYIKSLDLDVPRKLIYMERLRLLDDRPSILEKRYLLADSCPGITRQMVEGSFISLISERYRLVLKEVDQTLRAVILSSREASLLEVSKGDPAILRESTGYLIDGRPLWTESTLFSGQSYGFHYKEGAGQPSARSVFIGA